MKKKVISRKGRQKEEKNPITMSFLAFSVGLDTSKTAEAIFPFPIQRSENETRAATLRRTHSWRSFYYLLGPVIERNKGICMRRVHVRHDPEDSPLVSDYGVDAFKNPRSEFSPSHCC
ncbi:hypothetical protein CDAR_86001 [Caerostris darwini]|uniref:Uncharacterized protein n=1 Tax=Caerostris darwini TaxID=1538125 RepID=A0AAV4V4D5_9ARAC|nr:hypothetical protein CDAR_86001 [Caerostris darwini]